MTADAWESARDLLSDNGRCVVACHINPDADALGSALALGLALRSRGREVVVSFGTDDPAWHVPDALAFLPGHDLLAEPSTVLSGPTPALVVTTDTGSADRLGPLLPLLERADAVLVVDHHATNTRFGTVNLIDITAASTTVVVAQLVHGLADLDADIATCLYAGLVTDTGSFRFAATTPDVHRLAAELLEAGADPVAVGRELFDTATFAGVKLLGTAVARACLEDGVIWTSVGYEERTRLGLPIASIEGVIDVIRTAAEVDVAVVCKGVAPGQWSVSMRSRGATDVGAVAVALGGGGHKLAAGFTAHVATPEEAVALVRAQLP
ncbi:MAG TPA: bifunctional oligoribonuclease/PAP phosphatase NrnA [Mycobacteriales bacterium]|nr:bifunctional oligoribonuclease/PAP phosphatase NrnA [Mycobacteriales bacterium]